MQVPTTGTTAIVHELTSVLDEVVTAGYSLTDEVRIVNTDRLAHLFQPLFDMDKSGMRGASDALDGLRQAHGGLEQLGSGHGMDFAPFVDGIGAALKGVISIG